MKYITLFILLANVIIAPGMALPQQKGDYEIVGNVPPNGSLSLVQIEEFINFTCPHCNNFRNQSKPMFEKYGEKIRHENIPIIFRGQTDLPSRFFYIAKSLGRETEVKETIFDAAFQYGVNIFDPAVINYLARSMGIGKEFMENKNKKWVDDLLDDARRRSETYAVRATPTVIIQNSIKIVPKGGMQAFIGNIDYLVSQLLKN